MDDPILMLRQWFAELPKFTRVYLLASIGMAVLASTNQIQPQNFYFASELVIGRGQFWRALTSFIYFNQLTLGLIIPLYFAQKVLAFHEKHRNGQGFFGTILVLWLIILLFDGFYLDYWLLSQPFVVILYSVSSRRHTHQNVAALGLNIGIQQFPWVYVGFRCILGLPFKALFPALLFGYAYCYISDNLFTRRILAR